MNINLTIHGIFEIIYTWDNIVVYNENNKRIYRKYMHDYEQWWEYSENGNIIHWKDSNGSERWNQYQDNVLVHIKAYN